MQYRCHDCYALIDYEEVSHIDMYSDLCWIQCKTCAEAFGDHCGVDRKYNPHPHGYFACPLRVEPSLMTPRSVRPVLHFPEK